ncbi:MAG: ABC transporter ATP-binding protein [Desulfobacterium sp.]|nr:ABC transporter ATP-binding protein [Desulfobacterium sp.]
MKAIEVKNLSKVYKFYHRPVDRLKEIVFRRPFHQPIQSLENISFSMDKGSTLGIIGDNGAGKSTLLKILAGTLSPTSGELIVHGRVAALLELGAGFHFEFTGRQNIFLNASLLGLSQNEIKEREDAIIEFAELGDFMDRPLKTYSSGMVVRLAFSIATSVDPDILIIDEALSVGDQYFQKKCIDRMLEFRNKGKTILFCSHAMYTVNLLCPDAMWIHGGTVRESDVATRVTASYENWCRKRSTEGEAQAIEGRAKNKLLPVRILNVLLNNQAGDISISSRDDLTVTIEYEMVQEVPFWIAVGFKRSDELICHAVNLSRDRAEPLKGLGRGEISLKYPRLPLLHGEFGIVVSLLDESKYHVYHRRDSATLTVLSPEAWEDEMGLLELEYGWIEE